MTDTTEPEAEQRRLEYRPLADLLAARHPRNVKGHDLDLLDQLMSRFGYTDPVLLDERSGYIAAGHGRLAVLERRAAQLPDGPGAPAGILVNADGGGWWVPTVVGWRTTDDDELLHYLIAENRVPERGGWTDELGPLLAELAAGPVGLPPGWEPDEVEQLLAELGANVLPEGDTDAEYADDMSGRGEPAPPRTQQGLHEVGLMFQSAAHAEYVNLVAQLRQAWGAEQPTPMIVLRALRMAVEQV